MLQTLLSLAVVHWLTSIGVVLTTASGVVFLILVFQRFDNPYVGIVVFLVLPALFVIGLLLMPVGVYVASRRAGGPRQLLERAPQDPARAARLAWAFAFATVANAGILGLAAYHGVGYMNSTQFCGQTCHTVMQPQYVRYQQSTHGRVPCVDCHIGSGARSFIQYKLAGVRQLVRLTTNTYQRPIPPAMDRMRPAVDTCEHCHFREKLQGNRLRVIRHYADDEKNTEKTTVLLLRVGRIHQAHLDRPVEYVTSGADSQTISAVMADGKAFAVEGAQTGGRTRMMDCMDCHNRSGHDFETPESAVDAAIEAGKLDRSIPFLRRAAIAALKGQSPLERQPAYIRTIASENLFPAMRVTWGTYPNNIGHDPFPGCFRCHDGEHSTKTGDSITQDCEACHALVAVDEERPRILTDLGFQ